MKPSGYLRACRRPLFAVSFLTALFYLLQSGSLLIADEQDAQAKLSSLNQQVVELYQTGKFREAIPVAQEGLELSEKTYGADHLITGTWMRSLGELYFRTGNYAKAEPLFQRSLNIMEKALGPDHAWTATVL